MKSEIFYGDPIALNWKAAGERDILVDVDHASATGGSTEAAAWAKNLRVEDDGLCADFGDALYNEAVRRGYLKAKTAMFTSDGTDWICEMAGRRFKGAVRIVDFFHACEHLSALCEVIQ